MELNGRDAGSHPLMDQTSNFNSREAELEQRDRSIAQLTAELEKMTGELAEMRQRLEIRNLSLERLQAQFTVAARAVTKLLNEREALRKSRWFRCGVALGFLPKLEDDLR
jgi:chromosome segregation ATPase